MKLVTAAQMRQIEAAAFASGATPEGLMETAGRGVALGRRSVGWLAAMRGYHALKSGAWTSRCLSAGLRAEGLGDYLHVLVAAAGEADEDDVLRGEGFRELSGVVDGVG